jgi:hypothetical protein
MERDDLAAANPEAVAEISAKLAEWRNTLPTTPDADCISVDRSK